MTWHNYSYLRCSACRSENLFTCLILRGTYNEITRNKYIYNIIHTSYIQLHAESRKFQKSYFILKIVRALFFYLASVVEHKFWFFRRMQLHCDVNIFTRVRDFFYIVALMLDSAQSSYWKARRINLTTYLKHHTFVGGANVNRIVGLTKHLVWL